MIRLEADALLFDLDGTLINSLAVVERVWGQWAIDNGLDPKMVVADCHGRRSEDTIRKFAPHLPMPEANNAFIDRESSDTHGLLALPGAIDFLKSLPRERWAIVTSCTRKLAEVRMNFLGVPHPDVIVFGNDVEKGKPDPQGFLLAANRLGFDAARCVVFEDAPAGVEAGKRAGMPVVTITATHQNPKAQAGSVQDYRSVKLTSRSPLAIEVG